MDMSFPSQSPWEASLSLRHAKRKGRICCTEDGYGIQVWKEAHCFKMLQVQVQAYDFRTFPVRERNQETSKHKDSFVSSEFMDMPSMLRCQSFALSPPKFSAHSGDKEGDTDQASPGICKASYLPAFPATWATMLLLCPALATCTFQTLIILSLSCLRAFA